MSPEYRNLSEILVTRQPIFDQRKEVVAYNLFFKSSIGVHVRRTLSEDEENTLQAVDSFLMNGLTTLSGGKKIFIQFSPDLLQEQMPLLFPQKLLGVEIAEKPSAPESIMSAVRHIRGAGYQVMVGDQALEDSDLSLVTLADIVGCDFRCHDVSQCSARMEGVDFKKLKFLAKGVETASDFDSAVSRGYEFFQGDFFSKADLIPVRNIPSLKTTLLRLLKEINKPEVEFHRIEELLKKDVSITYKLLRFINSARFGLKTTVESIRHALNLMGESEVRKWLSLIVLSGTGADKPRELIANTIIRAKFSEALASELGYDDTPKFFLLGMFSSVDAFLDRPMEEIVSELPLDAELTGALLGRRNRFRSVLDVILDYERGDWNNLLYSAEELDIDARLLVSLYFSAVEWASMF